MNINCKKLADDNLQLEFEGAPNSLLSCSKWDDDSKEFKPCDPDEWNTFSNATWNDFKKDGKYGTYFNGCKDKDCNDVDCSTKYKFTCPVLKKQNVKWLLKKKMF